MTAWPVSTVSAAAWNASTAGGVGLLVFAAVLAAAAVVAAAYLHFCFAELPSGASTKLFDELCHAHRLSSEERSLLTRAASGASHPSVVFVDPSLLDHLAAADPPNAPGCARLRERLFGA